MILTHARRDQGVIRRSENYFRRRLTFRATFAAFFFDDPTLRRGGLPRPLDGPFGIVRSSSVTNSAVSPPVVGVTSDRRTVTRTPNPITVPLSAPIKVAVSAS